MSRQNVAMCGERGLAASAAMLAWLWHAALVARLDAVHIAAHGRPFTGLLLAFFGPFDWLLGLPVGALVVAWAMASEEHRSAGAPWSAGQQRRQARQAAAEVRRVGRALARSDARCPTPAVGVAYADGDLAGWTVGRHRFVVPPASLRGLSMGVFGLPGSGKTVDLQALVAARAAAGATVIFADCKGTDPDLEAGVVAAFAAGRQGRPFTACSWPTVALDGWRGTPAKVLNRLLAVEEYSERFYKLAASNAFRLALNLPGAEPVTNAQVLLDRLDADVLAAAYRGTPDERVAEQLGQGGKDSLLGGVLLRYAAFFAALRGRFDGSVSFEDADLTFLRVPVLAAREDADAAMRWLVEDALHYAAARKVRQGRDVLLVLDEFSAISGLAAVVIHAAERLRDVGVQVIVAAQSFEGLGPDEWLAERLLAALGGGVIVHRLTNPGRLLRAAGMVREMEQTWRLDPWGATGQAQARMAEHVKIHPDSIRQAAVGEAWLIREGRYLHLQVRPVRAVAAAPAPVHELAEPRWLVDVQPVVAPAPSLEGRPLPALPSPDDDQEPAGQPGEQPAGTVEADREAGHAWLALSAAIRARDSQRARGIVDRWPALADEAPWLRLAWKLARMPTVLRWLRCLLSEEAAKVWRQVKATPRQESNR